MERASREGGFSKTLGLLNDWRDMGPQTKQLLFPEQQLRSNLDNFFKVADMASHAPNPSGTALVSSATSLNPFRIAAGYVGSKLFFTPKGISLLTDSLGTPGSPGAVIAGNALRQMAAQKPPLSSFADGAGFDVAGSRQAGYTDAEIGQHLSSSGRSPADVATMLRPPGTQPNPNPPAPGSPTPAVGPHGPILRQFQHDAQGALAHLLREGTGDAIGALHHPEVGDFDLTGDIAAKLRDRHPEVIGDLQGFISKLKKVSESPNRIILASDSLQQRAAVRLDYDGVAKRWLLTAYDRLAKRPTGETTDASGTPK